jgi:hypothetical protein
MSDQMRSEVSAIAEGVLGLCHVRHCKLDSSNTFAAGSISGLLVTASLLLASNEDPAETGRAPNIAAPQVRMSGDFETPLLFGSVPSRMMVLAMPRSS